ncbi:hypothetical protein GWN42_13570 [candidate division KSB1 bacterium]|nr:hypothetical protein [candidate division KSB1 bacterium]
MPLLFNRYIELVVYTTLRRYTIRFLHVEFDIELNRDSTPNIARITIYNLSENTRNLFSEDHQGIEFYAGYNPFDLPILPPLSVPLLFKGSTINVSHKKVKADWVTEIIAGDGNKEFLESYFSKSYKKGTPISLLLTDLAAAFKLPFTNDFIDPSALMTRGQSFSGKVKDILDQVADDYFLNWSFQNQVLEVTNANQPPLKDLVATVLSPDTGMIESPILVERSAATTKKKIDKTKTKNKPIRLGVQVKTLLQGDIKPNRLFLIISPIPVSSLGIETLKRKGEIKLPTASTPYIADKVRHSGSNFGQTYETSIEGDVYSV